MESPYQEPINPDLNEGSEVEKVKKVPYHVAYLKKLTHKAEQMKSIKIYQPP